MSSKRQCHYCEGLDARKQSFERHQQEREARFAEQKSIHKAWPIVERLTVELYMANVTSDAVEKEWLEDEKEIVGTPCSLASERWQQFVAIRTCDEVSVLVDIMSKRGWL